MKFSSPDVSLFVDGYDVTPALADSITPLVSESLTDKSNGFGVGAEGHSPIGVERGTIEVGNGFFDKTIDPLHAATVPDGGVGAARVLVSCYQGQTAGRSFSGAEGAYTQKSTVIDTNGALTKANVKYIIDGRIDENGVIIQPKATKSADWDTHLTPVDATLDPEAKGIPIATSTIEAGDFTTITTVDLVPHGLVVGDVIAIFAHEAVAPDINDTAIAEAWTAIGHTVDTVISSYSFTIPVNVTDAGINGYFVVVSRATGGHGYQQVLSGATLTAFVGKIKHSPDASTWTDLVTFANTATDYHNGQRVATATPTTRVHRYTAYYGDGTTWGSGEFFAGFARG